MIAENGGEQKNGYARKSAFRCRRSLAGRIVERVYAQLPLRRLALRVITRHEGGEFTSITLRRILEKEYQVVVGPYSYGSLLEPGRADSGTSIGSYVSIGPDVRRLGANHPTERLTMSPFAYNPLLGLVDLDADVERTPCRIEHDVWIGAGVLILSGCQRIGLGAVVAAGAVVTHDVPDFSIVAGVPARKLGTRLSEVQQGLVRTIEFEHITPEELVTLTLENHEIAP